MSESIRKTIDELEKKLEGELAIALGTKKAINTLLVMIDEKPRYEEETKKAKSTSTKRDAYFNKPLATAVRLFLEKKGEAATVAEIIDELKSGGFDIGNERFADKNVRISLAKNTALFAYIKANDSFGLRKAYGLRFKEKITGKSPKNGKKSKKKATKKVKPPKEAINEKKVTEKAVKVKKTENPIVERENEQDTAQ